MSIKKALQIAKQTGDRVIVCDNESDSAYVIMSIDKYEEMLGVNNEIKVLTGEKMIDKINSDIAEWKSNEKEVCESSECFVSDIKEDEENHKEDEVENRIKLTGGNEKRKNWKIPRERKASAVEVVDDDKQYLEEIPF